MGVDINAKADICFDENFTSKIRSSFKKSLGSDTIINFEKGYLAN